ncbi:Cholera toxin secretion protein epsF [Serratia rubidaea]|uniref:Cholera toxin secretion protein epsF n=1 Tax=Serratia rubidaea TaxID=61652 RepID=A0A4U9HA20_SERRU|nr:Cholera toxin secretion protein epsF [Serratia rubidaea]
MTSRRLFLWQAINSQGELTQGESLAERKEQVYQLLIEQNLQPYQVARGKAISRRQWRGEALILFTRQLATLLQAGLPLMNALQLLAQQHASAPWRCLLQEIGERVPRASRCPK